MEIIVGKTAGFCYGVKRAVEGAFDEIKKDDGKVYCLGELVHNRQVNSKLEDEGAVFIDDIKEINGNEDCKVIIRAHGISKEIYEYANKNNIKLVDLTCPYVSMIHKMAEKYNSDGYYIFLTGKKDHPENIGTVSYCDNYSVIEDIDDVEKALEELKQSNIKKLLLISQTTYNLEKFYLIREKISYEIDKDIKFEIENTICNTTEARQKEAAELSKKADCMIIVGGKNSSNTKKLYEISKDNCENVFWVEDNIDKELVNKYDTIGIMAGASTPQESIDKVVNSLKKWFLQEYERDHTCGVLLGAISQRFNTIVEFSAFENEIKEQPTTHQDKILEFCKEPKTTKEIMAYLGLKDRRNFYIKYMRPLLYSGRLQMTIPDKPNTKNQKYIIK